MQKHINKKKKTDTRTGKTAVKKKNSRSKRRKSPKEAVNELMLRVGKAEHTALPWE